MAGHAGKFVDGPNILLFMTDQLTAFALTAYGNPVCRTPNIDRLAARGVVFESAYCNYPLCAPSRFSMMSGRLASRIGAWDNGAEFAASTPTFAHYLRRLGYYTCVSGKMHFVGPDQFHGFEERLTTEIYPADFSWTPTTPDSDAADRFASGVSSVETVLDSGPMARTMQIDYDEDVIHHAVREVYVRARSHDRRPFLMAVSLTQPHDPFITTRPYWDLFEGIAIDPPRVPPIPPDQRDPHSRALQHHYGQDRIEIDAQATARARRAYYGMVGHIDDMLGRLLAALDEAGFSESTMVVFASDHGEMLGERGMWFKKTLFEPAIRVPLILAGPGVAPARIPTPVSLLDLFPTFLDFAGVPGNTVPTPIDGASLGPMMRGRDTGRRVMVEHLDGGTAAPRVMLRDDRLKLVFSRAYPPMLHDLATDPLELDNLAGTPEGQAEQARLTGMTEEIWDLDAMVAEKAASQRARGLVNEALHQGRREPWDFVPRPLQQNTGYVRSGDAFPDVERRGYLPYR